MKTLIKGIVLFLTALFVVIVVGAFLISPVTVVERTAVIAAPPDKVFAITGDLRRFNEWSPWAALDPKTAYSFEGPEQGVGQKMSWKSNDPNVGVGSQTIVELVPNEKTVIDVDFGEMGVSRSTMSLAPEGQGTRATWSFRAEQHGIIERWLSLMFDTWIGADYEKGLANLKALAEKDAAGG